MTLFRKLLLQTSSNLRKPSGEAKTSGELIAEVTGGANLVAGRQTWELAAEKKDDLHYMKACCAAELRTMEKAGLVAAPYYFERVAILSRRAKDYEQEVAYCETYIAAVEAFYRLRDPASVADVRQGPRFRAIVRRLLRAKALLARV